MSKQKPLKATGAAAPILGLLILIGCARNEEAADPPATDQLVARSVADVRAADAAMAAPHEPSKSIAEIARPAARSGPARSPAAAARPVDEATNEG